MDPNILSEFRSKCKAPNGPVFVVGGAGYIGSRLVPELIEDGWAPIVIDNLIYGQPGGPASEVARHRELYYNRQPEISDADYDRLVEEAGPVLFVNEDVLSIPVPDGEEPVIWLASMHRDAHEAPEHAERYATLMVRRPLGWLAAGHPLIYASSMSVLTEPAGKQSYYALSKHMAEQGILEIGARDPGFVILRFGTVWGGLDKDPARPQTAINRALLGEFPDENYAAYTTSMERAIGAIQSAVLWEPSSTIENVVDLHHQLVERCQLEMALKGDIKTPWGMALCRERDKVTPERREELLKMEHPCDAIRRYYWPKVKGV